MNHICSDGREFTLIVLGIDEKFAIIVDGGNGLAFNLTQQPLEGGKRYSDGTIIVDIEGASTSVRVDGQPRFSDCHVK